MSSTRSRRAAACREMTPSQRKAFGSMCPPGSGSRRSRRRSSSSSSRRQKCIPICGYGGYGGKRNKWAGFCGTDWNSNFIKCFDDFDICDDMCDDDWDCMDDCFGDDIFNRRFLCSDLGRYLMFPQPLGNPCSPRHSKFIRWIHCNPQLKRWICCYRKQMNKNPQCWLKFIRMVICAYAKDFGHKNVVDDMEATKLNEAINARLVAAGLIPPPVSPAAAPAGGAASGGAAAGSRPQQRTLGLQTGPQQRRASAAV